MSGTFDSFPAAFLLILYESTADGCEATCPPRRGGSRGEGEKRRWDRAIEHEKRQSPRYIWWNGKSRLYRNALIRLASQISRVSFFVCHQSWFRSLSVLQLRGQLALPPATDSALATFVSDTIWISLKQGALPLLLPSEMESRRWFVAASDDFDILGWNIEYLYDSIQ